MIPSFMRLATSCFALDSSLERSTSGNKAVLVVYLSIVADLWAFPGAEAIPKDGLAGPAVRRLLITSLLLA